MRVAMGSATTASTASVGVGNGKSERSDAVSQVMSLPSHKDWATALHNSLERFRPDASKTGNVGHHMRQMTELLRIQSDISRYQLKVELVSKVSEGAVASVRKLQQNQ